MASRQVTRIDVHHHCGAGQLARQTLIRELLQANIKRHNEVAARLTLLARQFPDCAAYRIDLDLAFGGQTYGRSIISYDDISTAPRLRPDSFMRQTRSGHSTSTPNGRDHDSAGDPG